MRTDISDPTRGDAQGVFRSMNVLDTPWVAAEDISAAVAWLACDNARFVTGIVSCQSTLAYSWADRRPPHRHQAPDLGAQPQGVPGPYKTVDSASKDW